MGGNRYVCHIYAIVSGAKGLLIRMIMGSQLRTSGHNKSVNRPHRCPKVLGKPIHVDKSSPRYCVGAGTYSKHWMSFEFPRFLDTIEYSTNAMLIIQQKSYCHPALRDPCHQACVVYDDWPYLPAKLQISVDFGAGFGRNMSEDVANFQNSCYLCENVVEILYFCGL